jgi:DNA polymerase-1
VLLLDGHSLAYRAYYALPVENFMTSTGQATNAVYGFAAMLINVIREERPTQIAVAFDVSRQSFRTEAFPEYKAQRAASPSEFKGQVELIKELLGILGIPTASVQGYEADDVIATWRRLARAQGQQVLIVTGDRDAFQLIDESTTVLYPKRGVSDLARMTPQAVHEKYGLTPEQYADFAALRGDSSDNLPGIPGVGEKTATKWIQQFGSLGGLVEHAGDITGKAGEALRANLAQVLLNHDLTQLRADVPLDESEHPRPLTPWDNSALQGFMDALQFTALRDRLSAIRPGGDSPLESAVAAPTVSAEVLPTGAVEQWLETCQPPVAIAALGTWGAGSGELTRLAVVDDAGRAAVIDCRDAGDNRIVRQWLAASSTSVCVHDAKGLALALATTGQSLGDLKFDTALAAYVANPGQRGYGLADVASRVLHQQFADLGGQSGQLSLGLDADEQGASAQDLAQAAVTTAELTRALGGWLQQQNYLGVLVDIEQPLVSVLARMEHAGIAVDEPGLKHLADEFAAAMRTAEQQAHELAGRPFNLGSPKQLQEILFHDRGLPKTKRIKTGYTTDAEALQSLLATTGDPLLQSLLTWRDWSKLRQTVEGLLPLIVQGRIHTTFNQMVAATGRLSSTDPNLQNIPIRTEAGRRIRGCFVAGNDYVNLLTADYSQIEMRIMAHLSADSGLIEAFNSGEDLHTTVASRVFSVPAGDVDAEMRRRIKAMSYGLAYGLSSFGLSQQLGISVEEARALRDEYFSRFGRIRDYLTNVVEQARRDGYTQTMLGRRRYLPDLVSDSRQRREMAERMALNAPIQGTAADIVKVAMLAVDHALVKGGFRSRLLLQVHDELVIELAEGEEEQVRDLVAEHMGGAANLAVPLSVSIGVGRSWDDAAH